MIKLKKILAVLLSASMIFCLSACSKSDNQPAEETTGSETTTDSSQAPQAPAGQVDYSFDYGSYFDEDGSWKDVKALDYVTLPDYSTIRIASADIQDQIDYYINSYPTKTPVYDREIIDGDMVNIDYVGYVDGVAFEGGNTNGMGTDVTIGVTNYIDDFLEQLIGHKPGDEVKVEVTFPENYGNANLAGKDAVFETKINHIIESVKSDFTEEFVANNFQGYGWETREAMVHGISQNLALGQIFEQTEISEIPEILIQYQLDAATSYYRYYAQANGLDYTKFLFDYTGFASEAEFLDNLRESVKQDASYYLFYQALAENKGITVSDDETVEFIKKTGDDYDYTIEFYGMPYLKFQTLINKTVNSLDEFIKHDYTF